MPPDDRRRNILSPLLSPEDDARLTAAYRKDPRTFMEPFLKIRTKDAQLIPWRYWIEQEYVYDVVQEIRAMGRLVRVIILKARQRGLSTEAAGFLYCRARLWANTTCMLIADERDRAEKIFQILKIFHQNLPPELRPMTSRDAKGILRFENPRPEHRADNPGLGSEIIVGSAANVAEDKIKVGRAMTLQGLLGTEVAHWPTDVLVSVLSALARVPDSFGFLESTANGTDNMFYDLWEEALQPNSEFAPIFIPFHMSTDNEDSLTTEEERHGLDPPLSEYERDLMKRFADITPLQWLRKFKWRRKIVLMECRGSEAIARQEYPATAQEAFVVQGQSAFDVPSIQFYAAKVRPPLEAGRLIRVGHGARATAQFMQDAKGYLKIWQHPDRKTQYAIGADAALGQDNSQERASFLRRVTDSDFSAAVVLSWNREVVATLRTRDMNPFEFGEIVGLLGQYYGWAIVYPEAGSDGGGTGMLYALKQSYPRIGRWERLDHIEPHKLTRHGGFETNVRSKSVILGEIMRELKRGAGRLTPEQAGAFGRLPKLVIASKDVVRELATYVLGKRGTAGARKGAHDDLVIALGLALLGLRQMPPPPPKVPVASRVVPPAHAWYNQEGLGESEWNPSWMSI